MPIYEYDCPKCGRIEVIQKISEVPLSVCPECAKMGVESAVKRCISLTSFQLKGSGWYQTDYHGKNSCNTGNTPPPAEKTSTPAKAAPSSTASQPKSSPAAA